MHMEENGENLVESFEVSLLNDDSKDLLATVGDTGLDAIITGGALDGVPILGVLNGIFKVTKNYQMRRLYKKMVLFCMDFQISHREIKRNSYMNIL